MKVFGQVLPPVQLRFNSASKFATDYSPCNGIRRFGPYDSSLFQTRQIRYGVIYFMGLGPQRLALVNGLTAGDGVNFPGFAPWFRVQLVFDQQSDKCVMESEGERGLRQAVQHMVARDLDLVFVLVAQRHEAAYRCCKSILLSNGIPCQVVIASRLSDPNQRPWILGNIALASYAKVGGTPWVVADSVKRRELVIGVSRAQDESQRYVVGFVTLFNQDGDFLFMHSKTPVIDWDDYVSGLEELIVDAYGDYEANFGPPESLVIHFHKRPGYREVGAVNNALNSLSRTIPYALLHLNEFSAFRLFDTSHSTHVPQAGLTVDLSRHRALLLLDGRENDKRNRMGIPNVWDIGMDKRSSMPTDEFPRLVRQLHRFARVNWRGFNARSVPVTVNYSKLICDLVMEIGLKSWNQIVGNGRLRDKAWFL